MEIYDGKKIKELTMFFPAYNEEDNVEKTITSAKAVLDNYAENYEIMIVLYEGSTDRTRQIVESYAEKDPRITLLIQPKDQQGMGIALKMGLTQAKYDTVFYSDADNQFNLEEFKKFLPYVNGSDLIVGYRIKRQDPFMRILVACAYNLLMRTLFDIRERDVDCAFRFVKKRIFEKVALNRRYGVGSSEILHKARQHGYQIIEVGVTHYPRTAGLPVFEVKGNFLNMVSPILVLQMLKEVWLLWKEIHFGK